MLIRLLFILLLAGSILGEVVKIEGATNIEDSYLITSTSSDNNYGGLAYFNLLPDARKGIIRVKNVATELGAGATITNAVCSLYHSDHDITAAVSVYRVFKPWIETDTGSSEGGVTWNDWESPDKEWTTEGVLCANDDGIDNSVDDGACDASGNRDRKTTAESSQSITADGWYGFSISNALAQGWYDGTIEEEGISVEAADGNYTKFRCVEWTTAAQRPFFVFTYTVGGEEAGQLIIIN